jgi:hypothetical protein
MYCVLLYLQVKIETWKKNVLSLARGGPSSGQLLEGSCLQLPLELQAALLQHAPTGVARNAQGTKCLENVSQEIRPVGCGLIG